MVSDVRKKKLEDSYGKENCIELGGLHFVCSNGQYYLMQNKDGTPVSSIEEAILLKGIVSIEIELQDDITIRKQLGEKKELFMGNELQAIKKLLKRV
ncbi:MAG: hypothetical protein HFJ27_06495 [Clostridia bacterium]|nr:hypothetical protein [Clostridia bacterium]